MEWPNISVIIPTYNRPEILVKCLDRLIFSLIYSGNINYYVGNDGDAIPSDQLKQLGYLNIMAGEMNTVKVTILDGPRRQGLADQGLGANLNMLLGYSPDNLFIQMDDDHILKEPLYLDQHVRFLLENEEAGWIRLMGIANHDYTADLRGNYWRVRWDSEGDYSLYITSNRPHLKHRHFHNFFGYYPVNKTLGETEEGFCHQCKRTAMTFLKKQEKGQFDNVVVPHVWIPLNLSPDSETGWDHVGDSWQKKGE